MVAPRLHVTRDPATVVKRYCTAIAVRCFWSRSTVSSEKEESVVRAPRKPERRSSRLPGGQMWKKGERQPAKKQPIRLAIRVPWGHRLLKLICRTHRMSAPITAPRATRKHLVAVSLCSLEERSLRAPTNAAAVT